MMVGRLLSYWVSAYFQGRAVKLREGIENKNLYSLDMVFDEIQVGEDVEPYYNL